MKIYGIVSYNMYGNFTNYGSALQTYALHSVVNKIGRGKFKSVVIDYCPDILKDKDCLNPIKNMWDVDSESRKMCELSMPAIRINYKKFIDFYNKYYDKTKEKYVSENFNTIMEKEKLDGFICGSDTIFCIDEFGGFDDGYYANFDCMKNRSITYAASFGDSHFNEEDYKTLNKRLCNFRAISLRENSMIDYVKKHTNVKVERGLDPTLLLEPEEYKVITEKRMFEDKYLLLYTRRYNEKMQNFAEQLAKKNGWKVVEISLRAVNSEKHTMIYEAGVEEFLSLVKNAEFVVTNSYHGAIFSIQFNKQFYTFSREQCDTKITELFKLLNICDRQLVTGNEEVVKDINYDYINQIIREYRKKSIDYLKSSLEY